MADEVKMTFSEYGWITFIKDGAAVQFIHRWLGILIFLFSIGLWLFSKKPDLSFQIQMAVRVFIIIVMLQFFLGILTLINSVPVHLAVIHQAGAFFLFGAGLFLMHRIKITSQQQ